MGQADPKPPAEPNPKPAAVPRPDGTLTLVVLPDAEVRVGGRPLGKTPLFNVSLPEGTHLVQIVGEDRVQRFLSVPIKAGKPTTFRLGCWTCPRAPEPAPGRYAGGGVPTPTRDRVQLLRAPVCFFAWSSTVSVHLP